MAKLVKVEFVGDLPVYDITVADHHNFFANGVVVHNCMKISQVLSGFTGPEANKLRKAIGKKIQALMAEMKSKFIKGAEPRVQKGEISSEEVLQIWNTLDAFAGYGFNRSHAITYSAVTTVEMWLKFNYLPEYVTSLINNTDLGKEKHGHEDILVHYINYARRNGIKVLPPDINKSGEDFSIVDGQILFSLGHVKNVAKSAEVIVKFQPFTGVQDFYDRVKVETEGKKGKSFRRPNKKVVESLIVAGAFNQFGDRNQVLQAYYDARGDKKETPELKSAAGWDEAEKEILGLCLSKPPLLDEYRELIAKQGWKTIHQMDNRKRIVVFGKIESIRSHTSKTSGNPMYIVNLTDDLDTLKFFVFMGQQQLFRDKFKVGMVVAMPLSKFDDVETESAKKKSDMRFFDDRGDWTVIAKP